MQIPTQMPAWNGMHEACKLPAAAAGGPAALVAGTVLANGVALVWRHVLGGVQCWRLHFLTGSGDNGSLTARYIKAGYDGTDTDEFLLAGNPTTVAVTGGTAVVMAVTQHFGEYAVEFTFTPSADGVVVYADICAVAPAIR